MNWRHTLKRFRPDWFTLVLIALIAYVWFRPPAWVSELKQPAPSVQTVTLNGKTISLQDLRGQVVLVNYWASWCPYCRHEMPDMERFYRDYRRQGFTILAFSTDDNESDARALLAKEGYTFPAAMSRPSDNAAFGGVSRLPTSFIIDKRGIIRHKISGQVHYARLQDLVEPLLKE